MMARAECQSLFMVIAVGSERLAGVDFIKRKLPCGEAYAQGDKWAVSGTPRTGSGIGRR